VLAAPCDRPVVHPIEVAHPEQHVHPMVTHRTDGIVKLVDKLVLVAFTSSPLTPKPSSAYSAIIDLVCRCAMEEYATLVANNT
jgi:hypothetical protein